MSEGKPPHQEESSEVNHPSTNSPTPSVLKVGSEEISDKLSISPLIQRAVRELEEKRNQLEGELKGRSKRKAQLENEQKKSF